MKGSVIRRGNRWSVVLDLGKEPKTDEDGNVVVDANGEIVYRRVRRWHSGFTRRKNAERARIELLSALQNGSYIEPSKATIAEFVSEWLEAKRSTVEPSTWESYRYALVGHVVPAVGIRKLQDLAPAELNALYGTVSQQLAAKTVRNLHGVVHKMLADAVRWGVVARNVADLSDPPKAERSEMRTWTASDVRRFLDATAEDRLAALWVTLATTGARRSEVLGVRWRHVDLEAQRLAIVDTVVKQNHRPVLRHGTKTAGSRRTIALDAGTVAALRSHHARQAEERLAAGEAWHDADLVFCREDGTVLHPDWVGRQFQKIARSIGLQPIGLHGMRHTWATLALTGGVPAKIVSERLGHSSSGITLDKYSHTLPTMQQDAADTVANMIGGSA